MTELPVADWQQAAVQVASEIATNVLAFEDCLPAERIASVDAAGQGAYVPILSGNYSVHVGVVSDASGCAALARALLGMGPDEALTAADVHDAVGEIANMVAGGVKSKVTARGAEAQIGLPIFIHGHIEPGGSTQSMVHRLKFSATNVCVTVVKVVMKAPSRGSIRT
jgi:CheY-specific phosphatase CheX